MRAPFPGFVHHATSSPSVSAIRELGSGGAQRQKSKEGLELFYASEESRHTIEVIEERSLAKGVLTLGCRVTNVVTQLLPTDEVGVGVDFVGLRGHKKSAKIIHGDRKRNDKQFRKGRQSACWREGWLGKCSAGRLRVLRRQG